MYLSGYITKICISQNKHVLSQNKLINLHYIWGYTFLKLEYVRHAILTKRVYSFFLSIVEAVVVGGSSLTFF